MFLLWFLGSHDGFLKFWKFQENLRSLDSLFSIPVVSLTFIDTCFHLCDY